jgi:hypothetical protein
MSVTLRKKDGDLFIDGETGRGEIISGPDKVSQELFSLYTTPYDAERDWGSNLDLSNFTNVSSLGGFKSRIFIKIVEANEKMLAKQSADPYLDKETEEIKQFSQITVDVYPDTQTGVFKVKAEVGVDSEVNKAVFMNFKPLSINHVPPIPVWAKR